MGNPKFKGATYFGLRSCMFDKFSKMYIFYNLNGFEPKLIINFKTMN